jgi:hypothetical protein
MIHGLPVTTAQLKKIYERLKPVWFKEHPLCCVPGCKKATKDLHHVRGRTGLLLIISEYWRPLCRSHHDALKQPGGVAFGREFDLLPPVGGHNHVPLEMRETYRERLPALLARGSRPAVHGRNLPARNFPR